MCGDSQHNQPQEDFSQATFPPCLLNEVLLHMITPAPKLQDLDQLRSFVNGTLCQNGQLEVEVNFKDGVKISEKEWDEDGNPR